MPRIVDTDLIGKKFGKWKVVSVAPPKHGYNRAWNCVCECGREGRVSGSMLRRGRSSQCASCRGRHDLTGQKFGHLEAIRSVPKRNGINFWLFKCDCGNEKEMNANSVKLSISISCGCMKSFAQSSKIRRPDAGMRSFLSQFKGSARERNIPWELTAEQFKKLTQNNCHYCGAPPVNKGAVRHRASQKLTKDLNLKSFLTEEHFLFMAHGLDRVDSTLGYYPENVVPCCTQCNHAKLDHSVQSFLDHAQRIVMHQSKTKEGQSA